MLAALRYRDKAAKAAGLGNNEGRRVRALQAEAREAALGKVRAALAGCGRLVRLLYFGWHASGSVLPATPPPPPPPPPPPLIECLTPRHWRYTLR